MQFVFFSCEWPVNTIIFPFSIAYYYIFSCVTPAPFISIRFQLTSLVLTCSMFLNKEVNQPIKTTRLPQFSSCSTALAGISAIQIDYALDRMLLKRSTQTILPVSESHKIDCALRIHQFAATTYVFFRFSPGMWPKYLLLIVRDTFQFRYHSRIFFFQQFRELFGLFE